MAEADGEGPPPFIVGGNLAVPIKISDMTIEIEANAAQHRATGRARLLLTTLQSGRPFLDMVPPPDRIWLNGQALPVDRFRLVMPPDENTPLRLLDEALAANQEHELVIEYPLSDRTVQFADGGVRIGLFMSDLQQRGYLERHAPANLEFNQVPKTISIRIADTTRSHRLFTNGTATDDSGGAWQVTFPAYHTCSSSYLHLTDRELSVIQGSFVGIEREIPITVYGEREQDVQSALQNAGIFLRELEQAYGPYAHSALLIYCTGEISGGMEYSGATMTNLSALGHEITHSWFARGVMPANGNAGWIDEAIARWRDRGYPTASAMPQRPPVNLAGFSPYRRHTPGQSYEMGSLLLSELDRLFQPGGLRPMLARLFQERQRTLITTAFFQSFLEQQSGVSLAAIFGRYVFGKDDDHEGHAHDAEEVSPAALFHAAGLKVDVPPPTRGFTESQLRALL
jgi:hypothetical protein